MKQRNTRPVPPTLDVETVAFDMSTRHDLLELHRVFGLTTAMDASRGHFPGISDFPWRSGRPDSPRWRGSASWASALPR
ncbi:hypothetical protein WKI71_28890 [Streptomyces sp. MS1.AVA.1]|uniref:Uncharacterized protein n=1 Tax=Streptomyces machairae TaxID=3134109 RepID=A0ABU8UPY5_9ACTN